MKKTILFFTLLTLVAFSSCDKLEKDKDYDKEGWDKDYDKDYEKEDCFELIYPLTFTMPDETTLTIDSEDALESAMKDWYNANPNSEEKPSLNYPVDIIIEEITKTIANEDEMILVKKYCDKGKWSCFELIYPVTYTLPDGSEVSGDEKSVWTTIKDWYEANPNEEAKPTLNYPVDIILKDGETKTIDNEDDMILTKKGCKEKEEEN